MREPLFVLSPPSSVEARRDVDFEPLQPGSVLARPSMKIKSPFLADVKLDSGEVILCHAPALGCCGLICPGARVMVAPRFVLGGKHTPKTSTSRSTHVIYHVEVWDPKANVLHTVGTHPLVANHLARSVLLQGLLEASGIPKMRRMQSEVRASSSRFDFTGVGTDGKIWVCEVKNVPLADYMDATQKEKQRAADSGALDYYTWHDKLALFPDGYRSVQTEPVSARALKHARELADIAQEGVCRALLLFVVQRVDCRAFTVTKLDPTYRAAVIEAKQMGVRIRAISIYWDGGVAYYHGELPVLI